ncbi:hypothetical protein [uncultured Clostridium sp.]|uniref:hypothetical protein n=1 Tax=uncultured Clostridium sp. TaxID=59620 RepID=UPI0028E67B31|nr:hypothetical protein [uncultured Clostridium sp.]
MCIVEFESYGTEYWIKDRSDIDLAVIVKQKVSFLDTLDIEDELTKLASEYYNYDKIHLTFILFKEFESKFARIAVDSNNKFQKLAYLEIFLEESKEHVILKYKDNSKNN